MSSKIPILKQILNAFKKHSGPVIFLWSIALILFRPLCDFLQIRWQDPAMVFAGFSTRVTDWTEGYRYNSEILLMVMLVLNVAVFVGFCRQQRRIWEWLMVVFYVIILLLWGVRPAYNSV